MEDILDLLRERTSEGKLEGVIVPACLVSLLFKLNNEGGEAFFGPHLKIEEVFLSLCSSVKDAELAGELLYEGCSPGQHRVVGVELEESHVVVKGQSPQV